jgi:hypothetical protein
MARIPDAFIDDLLARTDIVELIGARVPLKRAGQGVHGALPVPRRALALVHGARPSSSTTASAAARTAPRSSS